MALPGDVDRRTGGADRHGVGVVVTAVGAAVALDPPLGAGGAVVGDRGVVSARVTVAGDEHRFPAWADRERPGLVVHMAGAVVALDPQLGAGSGVVGDRGVVVGGV